MKRPTTGSLLRHIAGAALTAFAWALFGPFAALAAAWLLWSPDPVAQTGRAGGAGAVGAGMRAAGAHLANEWRRGGPARARRRSARRDRWHDAGGVRRKALQVEHAGLLTFRAGRALIQATDIGVRAMPDGARHAIAASKHRAPHPCADHAPPPIWPWPSTPSGPSRPTSTVEHPGSGGYFDPTDPEHARPGDWVRWPDGTVSMRVCPDAVPDNVPIGSWGQLPDGRLGRLIAVIDGGMRFDVDGQIVDVYPSRPASPDPGSQSAAGPTHPQAQPTGGQMPNQTITDPTAGQQAGPGVAELATTADLRSEIGQALGWIERAEVLAKQIQAWRDGLPERYEAAVGIGGPQTRGLTEAIGELLEAPGDATVIKQALNALRRACDQADSLGEQADAMGATGHTSGYVTA